MQWGCMLWSWSISCLCILCVYASVFSLDNWIAWHLNVSLEKFFIIILIWFNARNAKYFIVYSSIHDDQTQTTYLRLNSRCQLNRFNRIKHHKPNCVRMTANLMKQKDKIPNIVCPYMLITFSHIFIAKYIQKRTANNNLLNFNFDFVRFIFALSESMIMIFFIFCTEISSIVAKCLCTFSSKSNSHSMKTNLVFSNILRCFWFRFATFFDNTQRCLDDICNRCNDNGITKKDTKIHIWMTRRQETVILGCVFLFLFLFVFGFD